VAFGLLGLVEAAGWDTPLFYDFNGLSLTTGPRLWTSLTILGDGLVCAVLFLPWIRSHPERVWGGVLGALAMVAILHLFKQVWSLPRPLAVLPEGTVNVLGPGHRRGAFPSGHTATFFLLTGVWAISTPRRLLSLLLLVPATLVGISRMAVGVHWPSDVLAGAALGWVAAWLGLRWADRFPLGLTPIGRRILGSLLLLSALTLLGVNHTGYPDALVLQRAIDAACLSIGMVEFSRLPRGPEGAGLSEARKED
jgi:membrane-associated phospholipid phosphatase